MKLVLLALGLCGCGTVAADPPDSGPGPGGDADPDSPDAASGVACAPDARFTSVTLVAELSTPLREERVILSADERELYLTRFSDSFRAEIWRSRRASVAAAWEDPERVPALNVHGSQGADALSADGLSLYVTAADGSDQIMVATRQRVSDDFGEPGPLANVNSDGRELWAQIDPTNSVLHFVSDRDGDGHLYRAERASSSIPFGEPAVVPAPAGVFSPLLTADGLGLYYARLDGDTGKFEEHFTSRGSVTDPFEDGTLFDELTPDNGGWASWVSADHCRMYFMTGREGGPGDVDVYLATREP